MSILFVNTLFGPHIEGHINLERTVLHTLNKIYDVFVAAPYGRYLPDTFGDKYIRYNEIAFKGKRTSYYINVLTNQWRMKKIIVEYGISQVIIASSDIYCLWLYFFLKHPAVKYYVLHHGEIDQIDNNWLRKKLFNRTKNKVSHIVLESHIKEYLIKDLFISTEKVILLPNPVSQEGMNYSETKDIDCLAISNSNDERIISEIIKYEKETGIFANMGKRVILRSTKQTFDDGYLKVFSGFLEKNDYESLLLKTKCIYLPFPNSYKYRSSGTFVDAVSKKIKVIGSKIPIFIYNEKEYPSICKTVDGFEELLTIIKSRWIDSPSDTEFALFCSQRKGDTFAQELIESLGM